MAFEVPASKKSIKQNRFTFKVDGATYTIPLLKFAPVAAAEAFEGDRNVAGLMLCCENDAARNAIRAMDGDQFGALMDAWQEASGVDVGESDGSADS